MSDSEQVRQSGPRTHSPMGLRHRGLTRATTIAESTSSGQSQRRNSTLSDSVSEARNTIRTSTDDLFFPRAAANHDDYPHDEESHWQSAPLGLALLPAFAGIFFKNGSAFVTDVTLLALAAVFLNWSVRLPWEWYRSARTIRQQEDGFYDAVEPTAVDLGTNITESIPGTGTQETEPTTASKKDQRATNINAAAIRELQIHELAALISCFIFPLIGTWILHAIRSNLSRPSEGLVSNYNLTIFLLAAEIRPFSLLLRMVQARTLHLQRIVAFSDDYDEKDEKIDKSAILDLSKRLEELESHVAEAAASRLASDNDINDRENQELTPQEQEYTQSLVSQAAAEYRKGFQSDIDALNRAVRRYEKRTAATAYQTESRLLGLESKVCDALALAAAAQRASSQKPKGVFTLFVDRAFAVVLLPVQVCISLVRVPVQIARWGTLICRDVLSLGRGRDRKSPVKIGSGSARGKSVRMRKQPSSVQRPKRATIVEE